MEQNISAALQAKINFQQEVNSTSPKNADGKNEYYTTTLKKNEYTRKDGTKVVEDVFSLRNHQSEEVQFALSKNGVLKNATYINWASGKPKKEFLAKDIEKLKAVAKDPGLVEMAAKFDWSKAPERTQENAKETEQEEEADIELE